MINDAELFGCSTLYLLLVAVGIKHPRRKNDKKLDVVLRFFPSPAKFLGTVTKH